MHLACLMYTHTFNHSVTLVAKKKQYLSLRPWCACIFVGEGSPEAKCRKILRREKQHFRTKATMPETSEACPKTTPRPSAGVGVGTTTRTGIRDARDRVSTKNAGQPPQAGGRMGEGSKEGDN